MNTTWFDYVVMATGAVGAITGIGGICIAISANRKANAMKSLDLRLELRKAIIELKLSSARVSGLLNEANASRRAVSTAKGSFHSGAMKKWDEQLQEAKKVLTQVSDGTPKPDENYDGLAPSELEDKIVGVHGLQMFLNGFETIFQEALDQDDEDRKWIRDRSLLK